MPQKRNPQHDQESLANALYPEDTDEIEEAILSIPPDKRVLRTEQYDFSVSTILSMLHTGDLNIPEYQRRYVWSDRQASRLIESLIIQCPVPVIYLNQERDETFSVIDGNQRLNSLRRYLNNEFPLNGLTSYPELSGLKYFELDKRFQRHISNRVLRCTVILKETHPQVKFDVFERLNSGAVALTRQELRHGLYYGDLMKHASKVAKKLKLSSHFGSRKDKRMKAEELVIRFWALCEEIGKYEKPLASFISSYAERHRNPDNSELESLIKKIETAHRASIELFGTHAFSFQKEGKSRFNAAVFDAQMVACSRLTQSKLKELKDRTKSIQQRFQQLQLESAFAKSVTLATSDKAALQGRIETVSKLLEAEL